MHVPEPVIEVAIEPDTEADAGRLHGALADLAIEDPSFRVSEDPNTSQTVLAGMGELHLEILLDRLRREFGVKVAVGRPQVAYRETVTRAASGDRRYVRQTGCPGQYGHIVLELSPRARGRGVEVRSEVSGAVIGKEYLAAAEAGIGEAIWRGSLAGFPLTDLRVVVTGGSSHPVDSSQLAFKNAGSLAFRAALEDAGATILEPVMSIEVVTPDEYTGEVIGDLSSRRGKITGIQARSGVQVIAGLVPLAAMFGYATDLRSSTQGRATYTMHFESYAEVPSGIRDELISRARGTRGAQP
jgi:elongation factor G